MKCSIGTNNLELRTRNRSVKDTTKVELSCTSDANEIYYLATSFLHLKHPEVSHSVF